MYEVITQIIALIANTYIATSKKRNNIYKVNLLFNICCLVLSVLQKDVGLAISYIIIIYRSVCTLYKDKLILKFKHIPITYIVLHLLFGIITWNNLWSLIPIVTPIITGCILWYSNKLQVYRLNNIANNLLWCIHNAHSGSYILIVTRLYTVFVNLVAIIKNRSENRNK